MPDVTFSIGGTSNAQPVISSTVESLQVLAEAAQRSAQQMAAAFGQSNAAFAQQGEAIRNYANQLGMVGVKQEELATQTASAGPGGLMGALGGLWQGFQQGGQAVGGFAEKILGAINPLQLFHSNVMRLAEVMMLWRVFEYGTRMIQDFIGNIAQLPVTMERFEASWKYTFGMSDPTVAAMPSVTAAQQAAQQAAAAGISRDLASWSAQYSYNLPYTRQNMLQAISSLSMVNLSEAGIKHYLPIIADLASTAGVGFGGQPVDLATAAYAIQGAEMGYSRMLRYDLHINPEQLAQYGYDQSNPATLLPALEKYANATHRTGAAKDIATSTWFGAKSSWEDRWQNFALDIGGYPTGAFPADSTQPGALRKGSPFDVAREGLISLNAFWDAHQSELNKLASFLSQTLGTGLKDAGNAALAFVQGVRESGFGTVFGETFDKLNKWLSDPNSQAGLQHFANILGKAGGATGSYVSQGAGAVATGAGSLLGGLGQHGNVLVGLLTLPGVLLDIAGTQLGSLLGGAGDILHGNVWAAGGGWLRGWGSDFDTIMNWAGHNDKGAGLSYMNQAIRGLKFGRQEWGGFFSDLGTGTNMLGGDVGGFFSGLGSFAHGIPGGVGDFFSGLGGALHNALFPPTTVPGGGGFLQPQHLAGLIGGPLFQGMTALEPEFIHRGRALITNLETGILGEGDKLVQQGRTMVTNIETGIVHEEQRLIRAGENAVAAIVKGVEKEISQIPGIGHFIGGTHDSSYRANVRSPGGYNTFGGLGGIGLY